MDRVFRALADPTRRSLLDELFREDGQTLNGLQERFSMSRFGVMKHLGVLEDAEPLASALSELKSSLERPMEKVLEIYIKAGPERIWEAITDPDIRAKYTFGASVTSEWTPGSRLAMGARNGTVALGEGEVLEADPPRRLVHTMRALWSVDVKGEGFSRVTWEIEPVTAAFARGHTSAAGANENVRPGGDSCRLTVTHDQLRDGANNELYGGWPMILSGLKTWLETGELLTTPGSLMYG